MLRMNMIVATGVIMTLAAVSFDHVQTSVEPGAYWSETQSDNDSPASIEKNIKYLVAEADCNPRVRVCEE